MFGDSSHNSARSPLLNVHFAYVSRCSISSRESKITHVNRGAYSETMERCEEFVPGAKNKHKHTRVKQLQLFIT